MQNDPFDTSPFFETQKLIDIKKYLEAFHKKHGKVAATGLDIVSEGINRGIGIKAAKKASKPVTRYTPEVARYYQDSMNQYVDRVSQRTCSAFFTVNFESVLMWSHYANKHQGICIEFSLPEDSSIYYEKELLEIEYSKLRPTVTTVDVLKLCFYGRSGVQKNELKAYVWQTIKNIFTHKAPEWGYEREWRMFDFSMNEPGYNSIFPLQVSKIILGAKASPKDIELAKKYFPGKCVQAKLSDTEYLIEFES